MRVSRVVEGRARGERRGVGEGRGWGYGAEGLEACLEARIRVWGEEGVLGVGVGVGGDCCVLCALLAFWFREGRGLLEVRTYLHPSILQPLAQDARSVLPHSPHLFAVAHSFSVLSRVLGRLLAVLGILVSGWGICAPCLWRRVLRLFARLWRLRIPFCGYVAANWVGGGEIGVLGRERGWREKIEVTMSLDWDGEVWRPEVAALLARLEGWGKGGLIETNKPYCQSIKKSFDKSI